MSRSLTFGARETRIRGIPTGGDPGQSNDRPQCEVTPHRYDAVVAQLVSLDAVRWVGIMSGPFDVLIEAMLPSSEDLRHLLLERLAEIDGITRMQTAQVLKVAKIGFDWPRMLNAEQAG